MPSKSFIRSSLVRACIVGGTFALSSALLPVARAEDPSSGTPDFENSKFQAQGVINANSVYVRSGASENDYPVVKLDKGAQITAVGKKGDWLKIEPTPGMFCLVAKAYVEKHGDGTRGTVTNTLYVRIASSLNTFKTKVAMKLEPGEEVQITGDEDEYFKIVPPPGVFLYVNKSFADVTKVLPGGMAGATGAEGKSDPTATPAPTNGMADNTLPPVDHGATSTTQPENSATAMNVVPEATTSTATGNSTGADAGGNTAVAMGGAPTTEPSTQPTAAADAEAKFAQLELAYADIMRKPLDEQDLPMLQNGYAALSKDGSSLPDSLRRVADAKATLLTAREKDREEFIAVKKRQTEINQRRVALKAENDELEQRIAKTDVKYYTAVGVLRPSSLQQGAGTLFRLTDPATGRTLIYIRSADAKLAADLGQFIGVKGQIADDAQLGLKTIAPESFEPCDSSKLYTHIAAQIVPPSLMPGGGTTAASSNE